MAKIEKDTPKEKERKVVITPTQLRMFAKNPQFADKVAELLEKNSDMLFLTAFYVAKELTLDV